MIILKVSSKEIIIFDIEKKFEDNKEQFHPIMNSIYEQVINNPDITDDSLVHLLFIFTETGYPQITCDFYKRNSDGNQVLYTSVYDTCAEIVTQVKNLELISKRTYLALFEPENKKTPISH